MPVPMSKGGAVETRSRRSAGGVDVNALAGSGSGALQIFTCLKSLLRDVKEFRQRVHS